MNEVPLGYTWPSVKERIERFEESIQIMKTLWTEEWVDFKGKYYRLKQAKLYVKPTTPVPIYVASIAESCGDRWKVRRWLHYDLGLRGPSSQCADSCIRTWRKADGTDPSKIERVIELGLGYDKDTQKHEESTHLDCYPCSM